MPMSAADRKAAKYHCGAPGDAEDAYPINSAADARDAWNLAGHSKDPAAVRACVRRAAKAEGWPLPSTATMSANFSAPETVTRVGKVFEAGAWPEKGLTVTEADLDRVAATFGGADLELEHFQSKEQATIFDGKLGRLTRVWRQGRDLLGEVSVPAWVDTAWAEHGRKISAVWDQASTALLRAGLVIEPALADAALFSADPAAFAGSRHSMVDQDHLNAAASHLVAAGAQMAPAPRMIAPDYQVRYSKEIQPMSWLDEARALFARSDAPADLPAPDAAPPAAGPARPDPLATFAAEQAALAQAKAQFAAERAAFAKDKYVTQAQTDVERLIRAGHVTPAQNQAGPDGQPALVALFAAAYADDAAGPALFAQAGGSRVAALLATFGAAAGLTPLLGEGAALHVLPSAPDPEDPTHPTPARIRHLKSLAGDVTKEA